ncbi:unnamed protein product [Peniophora sp. CBMAI 1063]|nr:unnamed protein product [Peniophora sp. CBMAI 1063]
MGAADPSYPLYPVASVLSSAMLLVILMTSFARQNWNLGVTFLCIWLFLENLVHAVSAIIWSDNAEVKLFVYCDIVSHIQLITYIVKPAATLIITRRLYLIASLQSVDMPSKAARRWNACVEWGLGLLLPLLVAGPFYYINQGARFEILEGFGCSASSSRSILSFLTMDSWTIILPLVSMIMYYPRVARLLYRQSRDINSFLGVNNAALRDNYLRILALASIDILLTFPIAIVNLALIIISSVASQDSVPFYWGWKLLHTQWGPYGVPYAALESEGATYKAQSFFSYWSSPVLAFAIFGLFGLTSTARSSYWSVLCTICSVFGWHSPSPRSRKDASLGEIEFGSRPHDLSLDFEKGSPSRSFGPGMPMISEASDNESMKHAVALGGHTTQGSSTSDADGSRKEDTLPFHAL